MESGAELLAPYDISTVRVVKESGGGGEDISIVSVVYPRGTMSVSSLGSFSPVDSSSKPSDTSLPVSLGARHIQNYVNNKTGKKRKYIRTQQEKVRHEEQMKQSKVIVRANLVVGC